MNSNGIQVVNSLATNLKEISDQAGLRLELVMNSNGIQDLSYEWQCFSINHRMAVCPRGIHADGSCSCHPGFSAEESGSSARAGISRIVMLGEALFEVLDQIHRQPVSLSLSMVSLPAPELVVDSFPVKTQGKSVRSQPEDDVTQCYICLVEYEEGDKICVLPCQHEYHISCIDKCLKEIHGVCPLCQGDVCEGYIEISVSN